jgi:hypothetical protein
MGSVEAMLIFEYGIPLAIKLLASGKEEKETAEIVADTVSGLNKAGVGAALKDATPAQKEAIVNGLYEVAAGVVGGAVNFITALGGLLKK